MTNEQLAEMIRLGVTMVDELRKIEVSGTLASENKVPTSLRPSPEMSEGLERRA